MLAEPLIANHFYRGELTVKRMCRCLRRSLQAYSRRIGVYDAVKVLPPGYYDKDKIPDACAHPVYRDGGLIWFSPDFSMRRCGHVGLASATSLSAGLNAFLALARGCIKNSIHVFS